MTALLVSLSIVLLVSVAWGNALARSARLRQAALEPIAPLPSCLAVATKVRRSRRSTRL